GSRRSDGRFRDRQDEDRAFGRTRQLELLLHRRAASKRLFDGLQAERAEPDQWGGNVRLPGASQGSRHSGCGGNEVPDAGRRRLGGVIARQIEIGRRKQLIKIEGAKERESKLERWVPGIRALRNYNLSWLPKDLAAGITLGAVLVPVGLAFGSLAGLPMA